MGYEVADPSPTDANTCGFSGLKLGFGVSGLKLGFGVSGFKLGFGVSGLEFRANPQALPFWISFQVDRGTSLIRKSPPP